MPCCTYLSDNEYTQPTSDVELNSLLSEVCERTGDDWRICETIFEVRRWFRTAKVLKRYELFSHVSGPEFQCVNFYRPDREDDYLPSINLRNDAGYVAAYLYGVLAGVQLAKTEV
jgi:hypothetical protein